MLRNGAMPMAARSDFKCDTAARTRTPILTKICVRFTAAYALGLRPLALQYQ